jgi:hypothetical protein
MGCQGHQGEEYKPAAPGMGWIQLRGGGTACTAVAEKFVCSSTRICQFNSLIGLGV